MINWSENFIYQGKTIPYNRIRYNNWSERCVEIAIGFDFLVNAPSKEKILEIGNTLSYYENALSSYLGIKPRQIIDKFEVDLGVENLDLMDLPSTEKYETIVSISTVEHIGQGVHPTGEYGENQVIENKDNEAPLKAIAKIYDLLELGGEALITVPFGKLMDGGWYIQFSEEYLNLLFSKYQVHPEAIEVNFMQKFEMELMKEYPHQIWVQTSGARVSYVEYHCPWPNANAIAVLEITKVSNDFTLNLDLSPTPLVYHRERIPQSIGYDFLAEDFRQLQDSLGEVNLISFPDWGSSEEVLGESLTQLLTTFLNHPDRDSLALLLYLGDFPEEEGELLLSGLFLNLSLGLGRDDLENLNVIFVKPLSELQWYALFPKLEGLITLDSQVIPEIMIGKLPILTLSQLGDRRVIPLENGLQGLEGDEE